MFTKGRLTLVLTALLAVPLALAGCVTPSNVLAPTGTTGGGATGDLADALAAWDAGAPAANVELVGEWRNGGTEEADAWGDYLFVDRGTFVSILNVSDPGNVVEVGTIEGAFDPKDVKVSDDGQWAFLPDQAAASGTPLGGTPASGGGIYVFDVSDKANPEFVSHLGVGERRGPHMVFYHERSDGSAFVYGANGWVSVNRFDKDTGALEFVGKYEPALTAYNRDPEVFDAYYQQWTHDMFVMEEPDGQVLMYTASWDAGLRVVDVTDPANPVELGGWNAFPEGHTGNLHTVVTEWVEDRRITVGAVEVGFAIVGGVHYAQGTERSIVYVWDTTDPANVELLGYWENPDGAPSGRDYVPSEEISSTHNIQLEDGRVYLAHYALGVWVLDVSTPETQAAPEVLAYYKEDGQNTWDVIVKDGVTWSSGAEGVLGLHYAGDVLGAGGVTSRA